MANYFIIGGDGKEYGPVTDAELRQWIAEERLNAQSLAKAESDAEFRPLSTFPEFASVLAPGGRAGGPPLQPASAAEDSRAAALKRIKGPAVALKITGILNIIFSVLSVGFMAFLPQLVKLLDAQLKQLHNPQLEAALESSLHNSNIPLDVAINFFGLVLSVLIFMGAVKMQSLSSYEFSVTVAVLAMLPLLTPCCIIGMPVGIWALVVLMKPQVKSQFH